MPLLWSPKVSSCSFVVAFLSSALVKHSDFSIRFMLLPFYLTIFSSLQLLLRLLIFLPAAFVVVWCR